MKKTLIIIPCYNEEAALPALLAEISTMSGDIKALVVNDRSTDKTKEVAEAYNVPVLDLCINLGIGGAVQSGLKYALANGYDLAVQMDGDGQHPPDQLRALIKAHEETGANVVIGSRYIGERSFRSSYMRRTGIKYFSAVIKLLTGNRILDTTSGFRLFDRKAIECCVNYYPDEYPEPESLIVFSRQGLKIAETPVIMQARTGGVSSIGSFASIYYMVKVSLAILFTYIRSIKLRRWPEYK